MVRVSLLLPQRCAVCARPGAALCDACDSALVRLAPPVCERCGAPGAWPVRRCVECAGRRLAFARARAAIVYDDRARTFVGAWKERGRRDLAAAAATLVAGVLPRPDADVLTAVPTDPERGLWRGHAPAVGLARALAVRWRLPTASLLERVRPAPRQRGLTLRERRRNVSGTFAATGRAPPYVCLVDDVYTTGATANVCAQALRRAGARRVEAIALARAVR
jgi:predicted amidophosphoribosyltransferase